MTAPDVEFGAMVRELGKRAIGCAVKVRDGFLDGGQGGGETLGTGFGGGGVDLELKAMYGFGHG